MSVASDAGAHRLLAMTVHNIGFLLDRLGQDCHPLQFTRELTRNSIEAIQRAGQPGLIVWDYEPVIYELEEVRKLCIIDTGDGMTGEELVRFINQLSSSVSEQSFQGNYGVGAKIAAATRNPAGVSYFSWKNGQGSMILLFRDALTGQYGLKQWERTDHSWAHYLPIEDDLKPSIIGDHGTMVVLHGASESSDTMQSPAGAASPSRWISKALNTRFFTFPQGLTIKAREGWEYPRSDKDRNYLREITGQKLYLDAHAETSGVLDLQGATAHWWILKDEPAMTNNSGSIESSGHVAALYQEELYEMTTGRGGMSRLQQFGITFGYRWVVIYVAPDVEIERLTTNTSRTALLIGNEPLPWAYWAAEFRDKLPSALKAFVESKAPGANATDHVKNIRDRLKAIMDLYRVSRYRPSPNGGYIVDPAQLVRGGKPALSSSTRSTEAPGSGRSRPSGGKEGNLYALFERKNGTPAERVHPDQFPVVNWVTVEDGSRELGDIEDRAAKFLVDQNRLLINADFRAFRDLIGHFMRNYKEMPGMQGTVKEAVHGWFEQALVEAVIGVQALRNSKEWALTDIEKALSEEALTACVMQRYHVYLAVKRELGAKTGTAKYATG